jgi:hypothetical protein
MAKRVLHRFGGGGVERDDFPLVRKTLVFADAGVGLAGLDRQQFDRRRPCAVEHQLGRAHGRAARRGRQHAVAVIGEEKGVDQLRLAARELGDKGNVQAIFAQLLEQLGDAPVGLGVGKFVLDQPACEFFQHSGKLGTPFTVGGKMLGKRHGMFQRKVQALLYHKVQIQSATWDFLPRAANQRWQRGQ